MTKANSKDLPSASATPPQNGFSLISNDKLFQIYGTMLKCRMLQACFRTLALQNLSIRQNEKENRVALAAGIVLDMLPGDTLAPSPGDFIPCFVRGLPLTHIFSAHSSGDTAIHARYAPFNLIPPSWSLSVQLDRALLAAKANKSSRNKKVAVAFCGNSSESWDSLHEAMRRAGRLNLPILLVCQSSPQAEDICQHAQACNFPGVTVDGDDAVAIYRVATEAMAHARRGSGPTLIECRPWPLSGQESGDRQFSENPILKMEKYLAGKGLHDSKFKSKVTASFRREIKAAMTPARSRPS
jgi:pyruvate dehydrogenase E1 component alpha subunit